jgi:histone H3
MQAALSLEQLVDLVATDIEALLQQEHASNPARASEAESSEDGADESAADDSEEEHDNGYTPVQIGISAAASKPPTAVENNSTGNPPAPPRHFSGKQPRLVFRKPLAGGVRTRRRAKPGAAAAREVKKLQASCETIIPRAAFDKVVRDTCREIFPREEFRFEAAAMAALQAAAEDFLVTNFRRSDQLADHAGRKTIDTRDSRLAMKLTEPVLEAQLDGVQEGMERKRKRVIFAQERIDRAFFSQ